jgi:uncharacterized protein YdeI (BOF family)
MKFKIALVAVLIAGLTASLAVAAPAKKGPKADTTTTTKNKGKKSTCRPTVSFVLHGKFVKQTGDSSFVMYVKSTNKHAKLFVKNYNKENVPITVDPSAKIKLNGKKVTLDQLASGDKLGVRARICKKEIGDTAPAAKRVKANRKHHKKS